ncbi:uncharacterized protein LOC115406664 [Salarias fasciatus]|nr:uncharacterized protein LOC115406664 [Salarias fasciatus]
MSHDSAASSRELMVVLSAVEPWSALRSLLQDGGTDPGRQLAVTSLGSDQRCDLSFEGRSISLRRAELRPDVPVEDFGRALHGCLGSRPDGIGVFLLLIRGGAYTQTESRVLEALQTCCGAEALRRLVVLSVEDAQVVDQLDDDLLDLIRACDGRYCRVAPPAVVDGLRALVRTVDDMARENGSGGYTESMLSAAKRRSGEDQAVEILRQKLEQARESERAFRQLAEQREARRARDVQELKAKQADERRRDEADRKEHESRRQSLEEAFHSLTVQLQRTPPADEESQKTSVVLLGLSGSGKSSALDLLLQRAGGRYWAAGPAPDGAPPTARCQRKEVCAAGRRLILVDTPELWDEDGVEDVELVKDCLALALPGPHVFLLVLQVGRFTQGESDMLGHLQRLFGREFAEHAVVLFVQAEGGRHRPRWIDDYVAGAHPALRDLVRKCGSRYYELNVSKSHNALSYPQVKDLLLGINKLVAAHGGNPYTTRRFPPQELKERSKEIEERKEGGMEGNSLLRDA